MVLDLSLSRGDGGRGFRPTVAFTASGMLAAQQRAAEEYLSYNNARGMPGHSFLTLPANLLQPGTHTLQVALQSWLGRSVGPQTVTVTKDAIAAPSVRIEGSGSRALGQSQRLSVRVTVTKSTCDGSTKLSYAWMQQSGPP
jgi:hypothetical protein